MPATAEVMLLSDDMIGHITGKAIITNIESPSIADIPQQEINPAFWGDADGLAGTTADQPGYVLVTFPYQHFQWNEYKYSFPDVQSAEDFKSALGQTNIAPTATTIIKTDGDADTILLDDGTPPKVSEVIVTTDKKVGTYLVHNHNGMVIPEKVHFELSFSDDPCSGYEKGQTTYIKKIDSIYGVPTRAYTYASDGIGPENIYEMRETRYGAVFMENGFTGASPLTMTTSAGTTAELVPAHTSYILNTLSADIRVHSPQLGVAIGLAPAGEPYEPHHRALEGQEHFPDMDHYQELGYLDIKHLTIEMGGCVPIYLYADTD